MNSHDFDRRRLLFGGLSIAASVAAPAVLRAQAPTVMRWSTVLAASHPETLMMQRVAKRVKEETSGAIDVQVFPAAQLGSPRETIESAKLGGIQLVNDGGAQFGQFSRSVTVIEAPYIWRDQAHMRRALSSPIMDEFNAEIIPKQNLRFIGVMYNGRRHLTSNRAIRNASEMAGFKLRIPEVEIFRAMAEAWGAKPTPININELYIALSQNVVDGQENPLPTIFATKLHEVQKFLVLTGHIITPRLITVNETTWQSLTQQQRGLVAKILSEETKWQDDEILRQETDLLTTFRNGGMTVIEPDLESFRKPVLAAIPARFEQRWGKGVWDRLQAL